MAFLPEVDGDSWLRVENALVQNVQHLITSDCSEQRFAKSFECDQNEPAHGCSKFADTEPLVAQRLVIYFAELPPA
jgi:hypothetical protein